jgi:hypothetical protein
MICLSDTIMYLDDNNLLNIYVFRMFYYDDIGKSNRRSRETKINDILS